MSALHGGRNRPYRLYGLFRHPLVVPDGLEKILADSFGSWKRKIQDANGTPVAYYG